MKVVIVRVLAHIAVGEGVRALQSASFLQLGSTPSILNTLNDNPEELKLTFDQTPSDLLSKLMQGPDDRYRCSVSFEIRPVMLVPSEPVSYTLLVGIDYQAGNIIRDDRGTVIDVLPWFPQTLRQPFSHHFRGKFDRNSSSAGQRFRFFWVGSKVRHDRTTRYHADSQLDRLSGRRYFVKR